MEPNLKTFRALLEPWNSVPYSSLFNRNFSPYEKHPPKDELEDNRRTVIKVGK